MKHLHVLALPCLMAALLLPAAARFESGTYYSIDEASRALVEKLEHYAASPVYGDETTTDISLNGHTLSDSGNEDSNCKN